jgi:hypothetical protein
MISNNNILLCRLLYKCHKKRAIYVENVFIFNDVYCVNVVNLFTSFNIENT